MLQYIVLQNHSLGKAFTLAIHSERLWFPAQIQLKTLIPYDKFLDDFYLCYVNANHENRCTMEDNQKIFCRQSSEYVGSTLNYLRFTAADSFLLDRNVLTRCYAAIMSGLLSEEQVYQIYIDTTTLHLHFQQLNQFMIHHPYQVN